MKPLYCWRCERVVPMMNEREYARFAIFERQAVRAIKSYRSRRNALLSATLVSRFYRSVRTFYRELSRRAGLVAPLVTQIIYANIGLRTTDHPARTVAFLCVRPMPSFVRPAVGAQPNTRLKLSAPIFCGGHRFVNVNAARRSLSAIR